MGSRGEQGMRARLVVILMALLLPTQVLATVESGKGALTTLADLPPGAAQGLVRSLAKDLPAAYQPRQIGEQVILANPAHDLEMRFRDTGAQIGGAGSQWGMRLSGYGYDGAIAPIQPVAPVVDGVRLVYDHGGVEEWYLNSRWGIEQGFTIPHPPKPRLDGKDLVLELSLAGDIEGEIQANGLLLTNSQGQQLLYGGLQAYDAKGHTLPARLSMVDQTLRIQVETAGATYPLTVDPWLQQAQVRSSQAESYDEFGNALAFDGDTLVVGAYSDGVNGYGSGAAYVFVRPDSGWQDMTQTARLIPSDGTMLAKFGSSVALDGDTVVIGAPDSDNNGTSRTSRGSAYVFVRPGSGWQDMTETARLTASDSADFDEFGWSVALDGSTIVVGAISADAVAVDSGAAYIFERPGSGWQDMTETVKLTPSDGGAGYVFGLSLAIDDDTLLVGAAGWGVTGIGFGVTYVFVRPLTGWWQGMTETARLRSSDGDYCDNFGHAVAIDGDTVVVGAPGFDEFRADTNTWIDDRGAAYVFVRPASGWQDMTQTAKIINNDPEAEDYFGAAVAIDGDTVVVGNELDDDYGTWSGSVYVFNRPTSGWRNMRQTAKLNVNDAGKNNRLGVSVGIDGETIVAGAFGTKAAGAGSAYVFSYTEKPFPWSMLHPSLLQKAR